MIFTVHSPIPLGCSRSAYTRRGCTCCLSVGRVLAVCCQRDWVFFTLSLRHRMSVLYYFKNTACLVCPAEHKSSSVVLGRGAFGSEASSSAMQAATNGRQFCFAEFRTFEGTWGCAVCSLKSCFFSPARFLYQVRVD